MTKLCPCCQTPVNLRCSYCLDGYHAQDCGQACTFAFDPEPRTEAPGPTRYHVAYSSMGHMICDREDHDIAVLITQNIRWAAARCEMLNGQRPAQTWSEFWASEERAERVA